MTVLSRNHRSHTMPTIYSQAGIREKLGDITFREAYDLTGRVLCIPVCSTREGSTTLFLSYVTTPDVLIWTGMRTCRAMQRNAGPKYKTSTHNLFLE